MVLVRIEVRTYYGTPRCVVNIRKLCPRCRIVASNTTRILRMRLIQESSERLVTPRRGILQRRNVRLVSVGPRQRRDPAEIKYFISVSYWSIRRQREAFQQYLSNLVHCYHISRILACGCSGFHPHFICVSAGSTSWGPTKISAGCLPDSVWGVWMEYFISSTVKSRTIWRQGIEFCPRLVQDIAFVSLDEVNVHQRRG